MRGGRIKMTALESPEKRAASIGKSEQNRKQESKQENRFGITAYTRCRKKERHQDQGLRCTCGARTAEFERRKSISRRVNSSTAERVVIRPIEGTNLSVISAIKKPELGIRRLSNMSTFPTINPPRQLALAS